MSRDDLLDNLSSDYVPSSLLHAAFVLEQAIGPIELPVVHQIRLEGVWII